MKLSFYLSDKLFIAKGVHKAVYKHPSNTRYCIKVTFTFRDTDIERELLYRKALKIRNKKPSLLPEYFCSVETNLGPGHVFEYIVDYDNQPSLELKSVFEKNLDVREIFRVTPLEFVRNFREMLLAQKIVVSDVDPSKFMVQRISADRFTFKVVDNIGSPVMVPLAYYFDFVAERRIAKYWNRFIDECKLHYTSFLTSDDWNSLYCYISFW